MGWTPAHNDASAKKPMNTSSHAEVPKHGILCMGIGLSAMANAIQKTRAGTKVTPVCLDYYIRHLMSQELKTIHTSNPIPKLTCTTQLHGKDPRQQLPNFFNHYFYSREIPPTHLPLPHLTMGHGAQ